MLTIPQILTVDFQLTLKYVALLEQPLSLFNNFMSVDSVCFIHHSKYYFQHVLSLFNKCTSNNFTRISLQPFLFGSIFLLNDLTLFSGHVFFTFVDPAFIQRLQQILISISFFSLIIFF